MSDQANTHTDPRVDLYLDGELTGPALAEFERELTTNQLLRSEVEYLRGVDALVRAQYAVPEQSLARAGRITPRRSWTRWGAGIAAALAIGVGAWLALKPSVPAWKGDLLALYASEQRKGFVPAEVCTTPEAFAAWTKQMLGAELRPESSTPGIEFVGWSTSRTFSNYTGVLLAKADGQRVIVTMDTHGPDAAPKVLARDSATGLRVFTRRAGDVTMCEITPLDEPRVIGAISSPK
jgi:hypothetical protein